MSYNALQDQKVFTGLPVVKAENSIKRVMGGGQSLLTVPYPVNGFNWTCLCLCYECSSL